MSKRDKQRKAKIAKLKEDIVTLEETIAQPLELEAPEDIQADFVRVQDESDALKVDIATHKQRARDHADETGRLKAEIKEYQRQYESCD